MKKDSVILYAAQYNALRRLTDEEMGFLFHQIFRWLNDEETEAGDWSSALFLAFQFLTLQITIDSEKYLQRKRRMEAARKSRKVQSSVKESETEESPSHARVNVNDNVNDNDNENVNVSLFLEKLKNIEDKDKEKEKMFQSFIAFWNQAIEQTGASMKRVRVLTDRRREAISAIRQQFSGKQAATAIYNAMRSSFCNGRTKQRPTPVDFDWLMKPENFTRLLEGSL
ncbi:MAG: hypothetical protein IKQ03_01285 [Prevotella sp.]|nr:hypothetical protein [Prevotella sp.]